MAGSRVRKPSRLAREIAGTEPEPGAEQVKKSTKGKTKSKVSKAKIPDKAAPAAPQPTATANVKAGGKRGRAVLNERGEVDIEEDDQQVGGGDEDEDEDQLWCICLGRDDHRPMIQCEGCENWFHFDCIRLDPAEAQIIEAFYCDLCEESGSGSTRRIDPVAIAPAKPKAKPKLRIEYKTDSEEEKEADAGQAEDDNDDSAADPDASGAESDGGSSSNVASDEGIVKARARRLNTASGAAVYRRTTQSSAPSTSRKKKRKAEGMSSDESGSDEEYTGDGRGKKRKPSASVDPKPSTQRRQSSTATPAPPTPSASKASAATAAGVEKTRKACVDQFVRLFQTSFASASSDPIVFATAVEAELFNAYAEVDASGIAVPKVKYLGKFRSLLFNIKNNPEFLAGLPASGVEPSVLAHMSNEDLQTPQQRAMAEQVRQQSLKDSVKVVTEAPRAKRTHKGEEAIDIFDSVDVERAVKEEAERAKREVELRKQEEDKFGQGRETSEDRNAGRSPSQSSPRTTRPTLQPLRSVSDSAGAPSSAKDLGLTGELADEPMEMDASKFVDTESMPPPSARPSVSFNLDNVWGAMKPAESPTLGSRTFPPESTPDAEPKKTPKDDDDMETDDTASSEPEYEPEMEAEEPPMPPAADGEGSALPEDYDPFASMEGAGEGDDELDTIIRGDAPPDASAGEAEKPSTDSLPRLWSGNVMTAEEGGFAGQAVQVGGRPLGTAPALWNQIFFSETLNVVGRLPVQKSVEYLVQSHFARTRELVVVELLPDLSDAPPIPPPDRVKQHRQRFIDTFATKQRHAVVGIKDPKRIVKDIYLVPLTQDAPLPEFVELLDDHIVPEKGKRVGDMLLAAIVLQKDVFPTIHPPLPPQPTAPASTTASNAAPPAALHPPTQQPPSVAAPPGIPLPPGVPMPSGMQLPPGMAPPPPGMPSASMPIPMPPPGGGPPPPPGFIPFVAPLPPSAASPPGNRPATTQIDYAALDVSSIKSLLANSSTFRSLLDTAPHVAPALARNPNLMAALQSDPSLMQQLATFPALLNALLGASAAPLPPPHHQGRPGQMPPSPRMGRLPSGSWGPPSPQRGPGGDRREPRSPPRGGEMGHRRSASGGRWDEPPRGGGGGSRGRREEFIAPTRDSGWGSRSNRANPPDDQYSQPVFGGRGR